MDFLCADFFLCHPFLESGGAAKSRAVYKFKKLFTQAK
jgi:hypothetical protein